MTNLSSTHERPRKGLFAFCASKKNTITGIGCALLLFSYLQPLHILPWISWHSEILAFFAAWIFFGEAILKSFRSHPTGSVWLPISAVFIAALAVITLVQAGMGLIGFLGDSIVVIAYLILCIGSITLGRAQNRSVEVSYLVASVIVLGAMLSVFIAFIQLAELYEGIPWINRMPELRRPGSNLGQPNQLASFALLGIAGVVYLFESRRLHGFTALLISAVLLFGLAVTESRSGALGLLIMTVWWILKRPVIGFRASPLIVGSAIFVFIFIFWFWPGVFGYVQDGQMQRSEAFAQINTSAGPRLVVWPQLWKAVMHHPWIGWGLREVSTAHNAVVHAYSESQPFTYAHNVILDLAIGVGLPRTALIVSATGVWMWRRVTAANDKVTWYCFAVLIPFGVHSMFEFPFAYSYFLVPVMFMIGLLEARLAPEWVLQIPWRAAASAWTFLGIAMVWGAVEYVQIEEDFRVVRFEAINMGKTPSDYERPRIYLLTQLDALLDGGRIVPSPAMDPRRIEFARKVAMRFPWPATQNRYALVLALNGNPEEAVRQLNVMRVMHGEEVFNGIRANWMALADHKYPQLKELNIP